MDDRELADKVVALLPELPDKDWAADPDEIVNFWAWYRKDSPAEFVRDWRVAGELMERCVNIEVRRFPPGMGYWIVAEDAGLPAEVEGDPLPRAIIEACVTALEQ